MNKLQHVAASLLEESFFADSAVEVEVLEERVIALFGQSYQIDLARLALNPDFFPDIRGVAARMFFEKIDEDKISGEIQAYIRALEECEEPLVKLGIVFGREERSDAKESEQKILASKVERQKVGDIKYIRRGSDTRRY